MADSLFCAPPFPHATCIDTGPTFISSSRHQVSSSLALTSPTTRPLTLSATSHTRCLAWAWMARCLSVRFTGVVLSDDEEMKLAAVAAAVRWVCQDVEASVGPSPDVTRHGH